jgi:hypothetical protein
MVIRNVQMKAFQQYADVAFELEMADHLRDLAPVRTRALKQDTLRQLVSDRLHKAKRYGFTRRGPLRFYLDLTFVLGGDFDTDPQYPWAKEILDDPGFSDEMQRSDRLYERTMEAMEYVCHPDRQRYKSALQEITAGNVDGIGPVLEHAYPEKAQYTGPAALQSVIVEAEETARSPRIGTSEASGIVALLMFAAGHGVLEDASYSPLIEQTLDGASTPQDRLGALQEIAPSILNVVAEWAQTGRSSR